MRVAVINSKKTFLIFQLWSYTKDLVPKLSIEDASFLVAARHERASEWCPPLLGGPLGTKGLRLKSGHFFSGSLTFYKKSQNVGLHVLTFSTIFRSFFSVFPLKTPKTPKKIARFARIFFLALNFFKISHRKKKLGF